MKIVAVRTPRIVAGESDIFQVLDNAMPALEEGSIVAVTSKIISICEGRVVSKTAADKEELIAKESEKFLPPTASAYGFHFSITNNTLIPMAGIDESNGDGNFILWPQDVQKSANDIRQHLADKHGLERLGVIITDSTCRPLRWGTSGISLAHSGFAATRSYIGKPDLFGRPFGVTQADVSGGLAAAAVVTMGEGTEQTPISILSDLGFVDFQPRNPTGDELSALRITLDDDIFAPFLTAVHWEDGRRGKIGE